jgi:hypothetical protein
LVGPATLEELGVEGELTAAELLAEEELAAGVPPPEDGVVPPTLLE